MKKYESWLRHPIVRIATAVGALMLLASCGNYPEDKKLAQAASSKATLEANFAGHSDIFAIPGILVFDKEVNVRSSPTKVNTINSALIDGNETYVPSMSRRITENESTIIVRGALVKDNTAKGDDARYYVSGYAEQPNGDPRLVFVGLNEETENHLTYYTRKAYPDQRATICGLDVHDAEKVTPVLVDGLPYIASNHVPLARAFSLGTKSVQSFIESLNLDYHPVSIDKDC